MRLIHHGDRLTIVKLPPDYQLPIWAQDGRFWSITRTPDEISIVCESRLAPEPEADDWERLEVEGPLPFSEVGVLAGLAAPLADAGVSVFTIATHDTDHLLIRSRDVAIAVDSLTAAGHQISAAEVFPT